MLVSYNCKQNPRFILAKRAQSNDMHHFSVVDPRTDKFKSSKDGSSFSNFIMPAFPLNCYQHGFQKWINLKPQSITFIQLLSLVPTMHCFSLLLYHYTHHMPISSRAMGLLVQLSILVTNICILCDVLMDIMIIRLPDTLILVMC